MQCEHNDEYLPHHFFHLIHACWTSVLTFWISSRGSCGVHILTWLVVVIATLRFAVPSTLSSVGLSLLVVSAVAISSASLSLILFLRVCVLQYLPHKREQIIELLVRNKSVIVSRRLWLQVVVLTQRVTLVLRWPRLTPVVTRKLGPLVDCRRILARRFLKWCVTMMCNLGLVWWVVLVEAVPKTSPKQVELDVALLPVNHVV